MDQKKRADAFPRLHGSSRPATTPRDVVVDAVTRCLDEMVADGVLEVLSWAPRIEVDIAAWAKETGHHLVHMLSDGDATRVWIGKTDYRSSGARTGQI